MNVVEINAVNYGSTGTIMLAIEDKVKKSGHFAFVAYPKRRSNYKKQKNGDLLIGSRFAYYMHVKSAKISGLSGCFSVISTLNFIRKLKKIKPDIVHLHNLHAEYINIPLLFNYIKKYKIPTVWTLHDCWAFTGHCPYFTLEKCEKWQNGCYECPQYKTYPKSLFDNSRFMYAEKRKWFTDVPDMTIVTPSVWLKKLTEASFLKDYDVRVINNGIDLSVFKPTDSDFRQKYGLQNKIMILGVSLGWEIRKGTDIFVRLANDMDDKYRIVLVGTTEETEKELPNNIISVRRTHNQAELAAIYTAADVFVNPTREDNYPTVNMEALACGTPVITFNTGGSPESIDGTCGSVVECDDYQTLKSEIIRVCEEKPYTRESCRNKSLEFDADKKYEEYVNLYKELTSC